MATNSPTTERARLAGVTLIELVVVMALLGILAAVAGVALREPIQAYSATLRRAELSDLTDTSLRFIGRDIRRALPNSPRVTQAGNTFFLELLLTRTGGRYRVQDGGADNLLEFHTADQQFDSLGALNPLADQFPQVGDILVVTNLFSAGTADANAYTFDQGAFSCTSATPLVTTTCNSARITGVAAGAGLTTLNFEPRQFPLGSPGNRFHVVEGPVTYICTGGGVDGNNNGVGQLRRVTNYPISFAQPTAFGGGAIDELLANHVSACTITYNPFALNQSLGLVTLELQVTLAGEAVSIYHEVHVSNVP